MIEGPDGTGKTALARALVEHGFAYAHFGPPEGDALPYYLSRLRAADAGSGVVADRLHLGSIVYGRVFRGGPDLTDHELWLVEGYLLARGCLLVYAHVPPAEADANLARGPNDENARIYEDPARRRRVRRLFDEAFKRTQLPVWDYDYTSRDRSWDFTADFAAALAEAAADLRRRRPRFEASMIGNTVDPDVVYVGDRPNRYDRAVGLARRRGRPPAAVLRFSRLLGDDGTVFNSASGRYLFQALRAGGARLAQYCVVNAVQWDGREVRDLVAEDPGWWRGRRVVALGGRAAAALERAGVPHRLVPHPQYVRRFHYARLAEYAALLSGSMEFDPREWVADQRRRRSGGEVVA